MRISVMMKTLKGLSHMPETDSGMTDNVRKFKAFISYRHKPLDKEAAERVQKSIERYTVPKELRELAGGNKLGRVFRDEDELPVSSSLSDSITYALDHSEFLIVICTPDLPLSRWCEQEIRYFISTHDREHVIAVLTDGSPDISFSPLLLHKYDEEGNIVEDVEPLAANIAGDDHKINNKAFKKEIIRIIATLIGCPFDELWQRERRERMNRVAALFGIASAVMAVFLGVTLKQNATISQQNRDLQIRMSSMKVDAGYSALNQFDTKGALTNALEALESNDPQLYDHRAEELLIKSLGAYRYGEYKSHLIYQQSTDIVDIKVKKDGSTAWLCDQVGIVRCLDTKSGKELWSTSTWRPGEATGTEMSRIFLSEETGVLLCKNPANTAAVSLENGSLLWTYSYESPNDFFALSNDGSTVAVFDRKYYIDDSFDRNHITDLIFLDSVTGEETGRLSFGDNVYEVDFRADGCLSNFASAFSDHDRYFAAAYYEENIEDYHDGIYTYILVDMETMELAGSFNVDYSPSSLILYYGISVDEDTKDMFTAMYHPSYGSIVTTIIHPDNMTYDSRMISYTLKSNHEIMHLDYSDVAYQPLMHAGNKAVVISEDSIYILDRITGAIEKSYTTAGDVLYSEWTDREEQILTAVSAGGMFFYIDLVDAEDAFFEYYESDYSDMSGIRTAAMIRGGVLSDDEEAAVLCVPSANGGSLVRTEVVSDPGRKTYPLDENATTLNTQLLISPSGNTYFVITHNLSKIKMTAYDSMTDTVIKTADFSGKLDVYSSDYRNSGCVALDEEHVLFGKWVIGIDGSVEYINRMTDENEKSVSAYYMESARMHDGRLLTAYNGSNDYAYNYSYVWIDNEFVEEMNAGETEMILRPRAQYFGVGENGFVTAFGTYCFSEDGEVVFTSEEPAYVIFDANETKRYIIEDMQKDAVTRIITPGTKDPVFVCGDDSGRIFLYHIQQESGELLTDRYSVGEIKALRFVPGDRWLAVLTNTGRTDILDMQNGEPVYSGVMDNSLSSYESLECQYDEEDNRLFLKFKRLESYTYGYFACIDTSTWDNVFYLKKQVLCRHPQNDRMYSLSGKDLESYPVYTLETLTEKARAVLAEYDSADNEKE